jgi:hypothetical protein
MTEAEWQVCADPYSMLAFLKGKASDRKLRLFACACCRCFWHLLTDERSRNAVEAAERFAEGLIRKKELKAAQTAADEVPNGYESEKDLAAYAVASVAVQNANAAAEGVLEVIVEVGLTPEERQQRAVFPTADTRDMTREQWGARIEAVWGRRRRECCSQLREVIGNPFRALQVDPCWLAWNGGAVRQLARSIYDEGRFDELPFLADALQEAGCSEPDLLAHCRRPDGHVRGCWAVDLLLGKS